MISIPRIEAVMSILISLHHARSTCAGAIHKAHGTVGSRASYSAGVTEWHGIIHPFVSRLHIVKAPG